MKYAPQIEVLIQSIIDAPEKDWSSTFPLVSVSHIDFHNAEVLIKRYLKGEKRKKAMEFIEVAKSDPRPSDYKEFRFELINRLVSDKTWNTRHKIAEEMKFYFPKPRNIENHPTIDCSIIDSIELLIQKAQKLKRCEQDFINFLMALQGLNIPEEIKKSTWINSCESDLKMVLKNESLEDEERLLIEEEV